MPLKTRMPTPPPSPPISESHFDCNGRFCEIERPPSPPYRDNDEGISQSSSRSSSPPKYNGRYKPWWMYPAKSAHSGASTHSAGSASAAPQGSRGPSWAEAQEIVEYVKTLAESCARGDHVAEQVIDDAYAQSLTLYGQPRNQANAHLGALLTAYMQRREPANDQLDLLATAQVRRAPQWPIACLKAMLQAPPPAVSAREDRPPERWSPSPGDALAWPKPPFPKAGALWDLVKPCPNKSWREAGHRGVMDLRPEFPVVAIHRLRNAINEAAKMIREVPCEHKIGTCRCPFEQYQTYQALHHWKPWILALLASTATRGEADMLEAAIIHHLEYSRLNLMYNCNYRMCLDYTRYACEDEAHREHYVYLAVKPLPPQTVEERVAAASAQSVAQLEASFPELQISDDVD